LYHLIGFSATAKTTGENGQNSFADYELLGDIYNKTLDWGMGDFQPLLSREEEDKTLSEAERELLIKIEQIIVENEPLKEKYVNSPIPSFRNPIIADADAIFLNAVAHKVSQLTKKQVPGVNYICSGAQVINNLRYLPKDKIDQLRELLREELEPSSPLDRSVRAGKTSATTPPRTLGFLADS